MYSPPALHRQHRRLPSRMRSTWKTRTAPASLTVALLLAAGCSDLSPSAPTSRLTPQSVSADRTNPTYDIETLDVPNALGTSAQGINAAGDIVGFFADATGRLHGFLYREGNFTTIDYQDPVTHVTADNTDARGINPNGDIVGTHWNNGEEAVAAHGYHRTPDGQFMPVHFPGHLNEILQRILPDGTILGCRHDHNTMDSMRGISISGSETTEATNMFASMTNGATPDGQTLVGFYLNMMRTPSRTEAYVFHGADTTTFVIPGSNLTTAWDVNSRGDIVGVFRNGTGVHGYVLTGTRKTIEDADYTAIDVAVPGTSATRVFGINERGDLVGAYVVGTGTKAVTHGFRATRVR
jgi:probable HAF family extracellular repeat protein